MSNRYFFLSFVAIALFAGCGNDTKPINNAPVEKKAVLTQPFRFHKLLEVAPGQDYDVLSWGRGSKDTGSFIILHSDSAGRKYTTTTGDLNGVITDVYNTDMDVDGNPEILIQAKRKDTINYTTVYAFEFSEGKAQKLDFPKLTASQRKGYRGEDNFYIEEGKLIREFPVFDGNGKDAKPSGEKRKLEYGLHDNTLTAKQLTKDPFKTGSTPPTVEEKVDKKETTEKKSKAQHHEVVKHKKAHKKKKRRHQSDDDN